MEPWHVLITGASGYIGGTVLSRLMQSRDQQLVDCEVTALVRGEDKARFLEKKGIRPIVFDDLDHFEQLKNLASHYDVIVHTASGHHEGSAKALIQGLGMRTRRIEKDVHYIHTSGTSNLGDQPITGKYHEDHVFSDKEDIYAYEKMRNEKQPYAQRQTDLTVIQTGLETGVKTYIIMSPLIFGIGTGYFNKLSIQVPGMIRAAIKAKQVEVIADGKGACDHVHVEDVAMLYENSVVRILDGEELASGERGIYFSENGNHTWRELAEGLAGALLKAGMCPTDEVKSISLDEAAHKWAGGSELLAELAFASNSRTKSEVSRSLGWKPRKTKADFTNHFQAEVEEVLKERPPSPTTHKSRWKILHGFLNW